MPSYRASYQSYLYTHISLWVLINTSLYLPVSSRLCQVLLHQSNQLRTTMAAAGKLDVEVELKSNADKFWECIRDSSTVFPKALPHQYKSIQVLEGDGKSVGSVRLIHYAEGITTI